MSNELKLSIIMFLVMLVILSVVTIYQSQKIVDLQSQMTEINSSVKQLSINQVEIDRKLNLTIDMTKYNLNTIINVSKTLSSTMNRQLYILEYLEYYG